MSANSQTLIKPTSNKIFPFTLNLLILCRNNEIDEVTSYIAHIKNRENEFYKSLNLSAKLKQEIFGIKTKDLKGIMKKKKPDLVIASDPINGNTIMKREDYEANYITDFEKVKFEK